jgi:sphinganine-1-phosphate aldolase
MAMKTKLDLFIGGLAAEGYEPQELLEAMAQLKEDDADWRAGKMWSLVYHLDDEHAEVVKKAFSLYLSENYINPMAFKSLKRMEEELINISVELLHGDQDTVGSMTSGGTESILQAMYTAREYASKAKPWIKKPEVVAPESIHVAFDKAAHYLGLKLRKAPLRADYTADPEAMERLINKRTILLLASAPQYPHGVLDPIPEIGAIAEKHKLLFHVDACFGGFILPWVEKLGYPVTPFDFRVPGVTSVSADLHKFGYGAKGASVLLHKSMDTMQHQFFVATEWAGGIYVSTNYQGTRSGGPIAASFASMKHLGESGYLENAKLIMQGAAKLREAIEHIPGLHVMGKPVVSVTAFKSEDPELDIYVVADRMEEKGWIVDRQQFPKCIHTTVMPHHLPILDDYLTDLQEAVSYARAHPELATEGQAAMYGLMAKLPMRKMVNKQVRNLYEEMYGGKVASETEEGLPDPSKLERFVLKFLRLFGKK